MIHPINCLHISDSFRESIFYSVDGPVYRQCRDAIYFGIGVALANLGSFLYGCFLKVG